MCGRFTLAVPRLEGMEATPGAKWPALEPRHNIAPGQPVAMLRGGAGSSYELVYARRGLVPSGPESSHPSYSTFNACPETVADKPAFRGAFRQRRCLIPADGWHEWARRGNRKLPWYFTARHGGAFAFAGLWERREHDGKTLDSCAIIVTQVNAVAAAVHERMPVILPRAQYRNRLDPEFPDRQALLQLLTPCPEDWIVRRRVGPGVNSVQNDGRELINAVTEANDA
jgi:putative SOS response-associated peptidase YedK